MSQPVFARDQLRAFVERIEKLEEEVKQINDDKRDVYGEAKANGFDVKALKAVISYRRKDAAEREEQDAIFRLYLDTLQGKSDPGTPVATRARARETAPAVQAQPSAPPAPSVPYEFPDLPAGLDRRPQ